MSNSHFQEQQRSSQKGVCTTIHHHLYNLHFWLLLQIEKRLHPIQGDASYETKNPVQSDSQNLYLQCL